MGSDTFSRLRFRGRPRDILDEYEDQDVEPRVVDERDARDDAYEDEEVGRSYGGRRESYATVRNPEPYDDSHGDDTERLYESFSDLYGDFDEGRSKTPFVIIGALLAVAIIGGGLAFAYKRGTSDGADQPVVVRADRTPSKVEPVDRGGVEIPHQERRIYDQVTGQETAEGETALAEANPAADVDLPAPETAEAVVEAAETQISSSRSALPDAEVDAPLTIGALASRVASGSIDAEPILPAPATEAGGQAGTLPTAGQIGEGDRQALQTDRATDLQPRKVRTVSIGPDGSVITSEVASESRPATVAPAAPQPGTAALQSAFAPAASEQAAEPAIAAPEIDQGLGIAALAGAPAAESGPSAGDNIQSTLFAPSPRPKPRPTTTSLAPQPAPSQQTALARPQTPVPPPSASGAELQGYAVQVASHRRQAEAVAKFADLQERYPNLLSGYQPLIQRADLGEKGIYYRLRIGPVPSRGEANRLCESLRSAGLPGCFVRAL